MTALRRLLVNLALRFCRALGYETVAHVRFGEARERVAELRAYIRRSGHLHTVSGRRPRAHRRLVEGLREIEESLVEVEVGG